MNAKPKGRGWKRDREFLSKEEHEKRYAKKRKKYKTYTMSASKKR